MPDTMLSRKKRNRISLVCCNCKERKIKCDRKLPCSTCIKSSLVSTCRYNDFKPSKKKTVPTEIKEEEKIEEPKNENMNLSVDSTTILDIPIDVIKKYIISRKPSRTQVRTSLFYSMMKDKHIFSHNYFASFQHILNTERRSWKEKNFNKSFDLFEIHYNPNQANQNLLNAKIEELICQNYYAVLERLNYFQSQLNKILFNSYIPMGAIQLIFHHYFVMKQSGIELRKPTKAYEYSFISVITSLVELTNVFTKFEDTAFNFSLSYKNNEFNELSVWLLNSSNFRRKASIFSVYALLNLRLSLMVYGDALSGGFTNQNSYPFFQSALNISYEIGINLNQDKVVYYERKNADAKQEILMFAKDIPTESVKRLWNYMVVLDAYYHISIATPLLIDDRYSPGIYNDAGSHGKLLQKFIDLIREQSILLMSDKQISLNQLMKGIQNMRLFTSSIDSFENILEVQKNYDNWELIKLKFELYKLLFSIYLNFHSLLGDESLKGNYSEAVLNDAKNISIIQCLKEETLHKIHLIYFIVTNTILDISQHCKDYKFLIYIRDIFSVWFGAKTIYLIDFTLIDFEKKSILEPAEQNSSVTIFSTLELEKTFFNYTTNKGNPILKSIEKTCTPIKLSNYLTNVYEHVIQIPTLATDYRFFVMTKIYLITIYFLYAYIKVHNGTSFSLSENFAKLKDMTQKTVSKHLQSGRLTHLVDMKENEKDGETHNGIFLTTKNKSDLNKDDENNELKNDVSIDEFENAGILTETQWDELASTVFDCDNLQSIFEDINNRFNFPDTYN